MKTDNQWHTGVFTKHKDGSYGVYESLDDASDSADKLPKRKSFRKIRYNWNHGQPILDFGSFKMAICDSSYGKVTGQFQECRGIMEEVK